MSATTQVLTLWGRANSVNVQKTLWALDEFGLSFEHRVVGGRFGGLKRPEFAALTPVRRVPVLQDGAITVWESHAILRHLARREAAHPIGAQMRAPATAAAADMWMDFSATTLQPPFIGLFWQRVRTPTPKRKATVDQRHHRSVSEALAVVEGVLSDGRDHLAGDEFGLADMAAGSLLHRLLEIAPDFTSAFPGVAAWRDRLAARPAYRGRVAVDYEDLRAD